MNKEELMNKFRSFVEQIDVEELDNIWSIQSKIFREFWENKIMNDSYPSLTDSEIDEIILILDKNAKGSKSHTNAVARAMIPQGAWRRMFSQIKENKNIKNILNKLFKSKIDQEKIDLIDEIYKINEGRKNNLTGKSGNAINCMLFAYNPLNNLAVISLNDRRKIIEQYLLNSDIDFDENSQGKNIIESGNLIIKKFTNLGIQCSPMILTRFLYFTLKNEWKKIEDSEEVKYIEKTKEEFLVQDEDSNFHMEKELENFLIRNWDKTELGKYYDLIEEGGELVSQQYKTDIGIIDILVEDKKTKQLVVIELKRSQTSDDTIGQVLRYIGWLEENKTKGKNVKGIIIASNYDKKLYYALNALRNTNNIQIFLYRINFTLTEHKE